MHRLEKKHIAELEAQNALLLLEKGRLEAENTHLRKSTTNSAVTIGLLRHENSELKDKVKKLTNGHL